MVIRWDKDEYVTAALVRRVAVKISNSTGGETLKFYRWFSGFGSYMEKK